MFKLPEKIDQMESIRTLIVRFDNELKRYELSKFRGAVIDLIGVDDVYFHNHVEDRLRYAYPLIQYKRINGKAALMCFNEGTDSIGRLFASDRKNIQLGDREFLLELNEMKANRFRVQVWDKLFNYRIRGWLALNSVNFERYKMLDSLVEKTEMLQRALVGNVLSFGKGIGVHFDKQIECVITKLEEPFLVKHKQTSFMSFDVEFKCNVSIPDFAGLGKGASHGFGIVTQQRVKSETIIE